MNCDSSEGLSFVITHHPLTEGQLCSLSDLSVLSGLETVAEHPTLSQAGSSIEGRAWLACPLSQEHKTGAPYCPIILLLPGLNPVKQRARVPPLKPRAPREEK